MYRAKENGLHFSTESENTYLVLSLETASGISHDEWKIVPWGLPEDRRIPDIATMSNTVQLRLDGPGGYRPENIRLNGTRLEGYSVAQVLPFGTLR